MNRTILVGRLTKKPELRTTGQSSVASFTIAVNRPFKNKDGEHDTDFINVSIFGIQADNVAKYCDKGSQVGIDGRIQTRTYDTDKGEKRYVTEVIAERVEFLGSKQEGQAPAEITQESQQESDPYKDFGEEIKLTDDDLPF